MSVHFNRNGDPTDGKIDFPMIPSDTLFEEVIFHSSGNYCVCFADIVGSTITISKINDGKDRAKYYAIFLNYVSAVARQFGGKIIKNAGDGLFWCFPETQDYTSYQVIERAIDCCMTLTETHTIINNLMLQEGLPCVDYRVSADYGRLEVALTKTSVGDDFFGPTMNMCVKINSKAPLNGLVVGGDLYEMIRHFPLHSAYHFNEVKKGGQDTFGVSKPYPVFSIKRKIKDTEEYYHHQLPDFLEKTSSYVIAAKANNPCNNSRGFGYESTGESEEQHKQEGESHVLKSHENNRRANIMIIDDEPDALLSLKAFLENKPYSVEVFNSGREALQKFALLGSSHYNLVITDVRMPDMNGLQLYNSLKAINRNVRVIFVTALDIAQELISILPGLKEKDVIRKPISRSEFIQIVEKSTAQSEQ
jgi:two-component system, OmpR family, response regulator ChvI